MNQRDIINLIDDEDELLAALAAWAREKTMEERAAKIRRITIAIGKVPLFVETGRERRVNVARTFNRKRPSCGKRDTAAQLSSLRRS